MTEKTAVPKPVVLCVLDGWGERPPGPDNAIELANIPNWRRFIAESPNALLKTSGLAVGLPEGQMGNSEVGHMNLGAGRVVMQDLPRIDAAIAGGEVEASPALNELIAALAESGGACHLMGLMSPGGVHAHQAHIAALARILDARGIPVRVHAFMDGRDTPPSAGRGYLKDFEKAVADCENVAVATVSGRYFAMDRDKRWDREQKAYDAMVSAAGKGAPTADAAMAAAYEAGETDEFVAPRVVGPYAGMADGDAVLMANFRSDRAREILTALLDPAFAGFARAKTVGFVGRVGMVSYSDELDALMTAIFPPQTLVNVLGEVVSKAGLKQLRIAETEKYAHVTFFLNGGEEKVFPGEERIMVPSPKVATYDLQPEMSAPEVTDKLVAAVESGVFDLIVINFANGDMVGHTGIIEAAVKAAETVDLCIGRLDAAVAKMGGTLLMTADHGNAEQMRDPVTGGPYTAHTTGPVRAVLRHAPARVKALREGALCDVAPTLLNLMGLPQPAEMTGRCLFAED
ncbi:2,3-bisphosphoglycerate-independent phosphoglycerate mutase [Oleispirillum naphthae]|uniref:2,3-bisphosphoglycerate-independent phosphoglycerate mutase n=1 Tax=Oleispirillum naphthae TaxID=2838853 RepID=UPI0030822BBF